MKILVIGINYYPEIISTGLYTTEMCEWLVKRGHQVTVITGFPFYPEWRIARNYRKKIFQKERINGVDIYRSYVYVPKKVTTKGRVLHELSFELSSLINLFKQLFKKPNVIISICPPMLVGFHGYLLTLFKRVPFIYHVQDLQVDAASDLKMINNRRLLDLIERLEKFIFKKTVKITTISVGMRDKIIRKGVAAEKVTLFPNWANLNKIKPYPKNNEFRINNNISENKFLVLYAGNIGEKQGLDSVIQAASLIENKFEIQFLFVGDGAKKAELIQKSKALNLTNVSFLGVQPSEILPKMLCAADICLISQQKTVTDIVMPSKLTNILASGTPVLVFANKSCEVAKLVIQHECGLIAEPENPEAMANIIIHLFKERSTLKKLGMNGRRYAEENLDMDKILLKLESNLYNICNRNIEQINKSK